MGLGRGTAALLENHPLYCHGGIAPALVLDATLSRWARSTPDALYPIALQSRYVSPGMAWYLNNYLWILFALFGILALTMLFHRDKIERVR
jgi:hypothetical protein